MTFEAIEYCVEEGVGVLRFNRPETLNSFNAQMHREVREALASARRDPAVRCLLITGNGRGFCAGQDLNDRAVAPGAGAVDLGDSVEQNYNPLIRAIVALEMPVICAVNGVAAGAGSSIALACDIVLAARSAKFVQAFAKIGVVPDSGGTWNLPRAIGLPRAKGLALLGEKRIDGHAQTLHGDRNQGRRGRTEHPFSTKVKGHERRTFCTAGTAVARFEIPSANRIRAIAEGKVNPAHAANAPL